ncbi:MAG: DUF5305 domain-containing protein [Syntrophomonadaceae bacterium]|jgi:hypothetical protein|nr:DUF5305 domain-containing protein [Syntrophomonadaceae bacterium]
MSRKIRINPTLRKSILTVLVLLLLGSGGMAIWWYLQPTEKTEEAAVYNCLQEAEINYRVYYLANNFFTNEGADPGLAYMTPLTNYINTSYTYRFKGDSQAEVNGEYKVTAALTGYLTREKAGSKDETELVKLFEKEELLIPATPFQTKDQVLTINNQAPVNFRSYVDFINAVNQELRITSNLVQLSITYHVSSLIKTADGEVKEELAPVMIIPVEGNTFMVQGQLMDQKEGTVTKAQLVPVPEARTLFRNYTIAAAVFLFLLLLMSIKTTERVRDPLENELKKIMKKYGDFIAAGRGAIPAVDHEKTIVMQSFDDLIKVADEIGQPVLYDNNRGRNHTFCVISDLLVYRYNLKDAV